MKTIASFTVNHDTLQKGMYVSRIDGDVVTYDIRMKVPNQGDYLSNGAMHTFEHLFATCARNGQWADQVLYVGPMGCRTGFYFLSRGLTDAQVLMLLREAMAFTAAFDGEVPGVSAEVCGNYREHDLPRAREDAARMLAVLQNWTPEKMQYGM